MRRNQERTDGTATRRSPLPQEEPRQSPENPARRNVGRGACRQHRRHRHPPAAGRLGKERRADDRLWRATRPHRHRDRPPRDRRPRQRSRRPRPYARGQRECRPRAHGDRRPLARRSKVSPPRTGPKRRSPPRSRFPCARSASCVCSRTVHPAILDQIGAGDMPREQDLRTIASASREDQAAVWKKMKPKKSEGVIWWQISQALQKTRFFAKDAKFGEAEREAFGIVWQEDLFAQGRRGQSFHHRRRGLRRRPARMGRREHAEERRLDRDRRVRPRETAAEGESHLGEAEEGRPDRLCDRSARRQDPRSGVPHLRARRDEGQGSFDRRRRRRADAEEDAPRDHPKGD